RCRPLRRPHARTPRASPSTHRGAYWTAMPSRSQPPPNARRDSYRRAAVLLLAATFAAPAARAQDVSTLRRDLIAARLDLLQTQAELDAAKQEQAAHLEQAAAVTDGGAARVSQFGPDEQNLILPEIGRALQAAHSARASALRELVKLTEAEKK